MTIIKTVCQHCERTTVVPSKVIDAAFGDKAIELRKHAVDDAMIERAARAVEKATTQASYGWTDEQFEIWWNADPHFVSQIKTWSDFQGTAKERLLWETRIALEAALETGDNS